MIRNSTFDIMKGIGIITVIIGHLTCLDFYPYRNIIFSFHMPLFFLLAGYFFHPSIDFHKKIVKDFRRLIVPYIFTAFIFMIYYNISYSDEYAFRRSLIMVLYGSGAKHTSYFLSSISSIGAIWFLLALFWCRTFYNYIFCKTHKKSIILCIAILATLIDRYLINLPLSILPGLSAMVFYMIGHIFQTTQIKSYMIFIGIVCWIWGCCFSSIFMVKCYYAYYPIDVLGACGGTYVIFLLSKYVKETRFCTILTWIGNISIVILCCHLLEMHMGICNNIFPEIWYIQIPVQLIFNITIAWIIIKIPLVKQVFSLK